MHSAFDFELLYNPAEKGEVIIQTHTVDCSNTHACTHYCKVNTHA